MKRWSFWIDRGGTFTDIVACHPDGSLEARKYLSENRHKYTEPAAYGMRDFLNLPPDAPLPWAKIESVRVGTTVATNTLLQRCGAAVGLAVTQGFGDALHIGTQRRPELFALHIQRPVPLFEKRVEICERIAADGTVVLALQEEDTRKKLQALYDQGLRTLAILLMHSFHYPRHELRVAKLAHSIGFRKIFPSHRAAALIGFLRRGDTAVADAYLSPALIDWRRQLENCFDGPPPKGRLLFMNSAGGLVGSEDFSGKNAVLSGPAGGVVATAKLCQHSEFTRCISFDMGGTSTDVALCEGPLEKNLNNVVDGVRLAVPMMYIHTVAAGGSSKLHSEQNRLRVGPDSAGADPGPLCYGRGGPLCLSDAQLQLGVLMSEYMPVCFGVDGKQALDGNAVRQRFEQWGRSLARSAEQLAEDFVEIAVAEMARAVRRVTVRRGLEAAEYALCSFGSAAGQYVCSLAESLGVREILCPPLAGALSAWGMGLAQIRASRELSIEEPLNLDLLHSLERKSRALATELCEDLCRQHPQIRHWDTALCLQLRYSNTQANIEIPWLSATERDIAALRKKFEETHFQRFGFVIEEREILVATLLVELCAAENSKLTHSGTSEYRLTASPPPNALTRVFLDGSWREIPVLWRSALTPGEKLRGPLLLYEELSTLLLRPGWEMCLAEQGRLHLRRCSSTGRTVQNPPLTRRGKLARMEVFNHRFMSIAEQMGIVLQNSAQSLNIRERMDFSCAVFDSRGRLIANAPHIPVHLGSMSMTVQAMMHKHVGDIRPGDAWVTNAPSLGGTHLPDITVIRPVFCGASGEGEKPAFFTAARGHHADIGGLSPGSMPADSRKIQEEGILLDGFHLIRDGKFAEQKLRHILSQSAWPTRNADQNIADLQAQLAACLLGELQLHALNEEYGLQTVQDCVRRLYMVAAEAVRRVLGDLKDGEYSVQMDNGARIHAALRIDRKNRRAEIDFSGSSEQCNDNYNAPMAVCRAVVMYVFRCLIKEDIPLNEGCLAPLQLRIPSGSLLCPGADAAVVAGNVESSQALADCLFGALGQLAAAQGTMNNFSCGDRHYQYYETLGGGSGAGPGFPGSSAVHSHMSNSRLSDPEILENALPLRIESCSIRRRSGGRGQWNGGDGMQRSLVFLAPMQISLISNRRRTRSFGLHGGAAGLPGHNLLLRADGVCEELPYACRLDLEAGDRLRILTPGGGGFGTVTMNCKTSSRIKKD